MCDLKPEGCIVAHVVPRLDGRRSADGQWAARCPVHADDHRSLSISIGTRGQRIVWKCWAKCSPEAVRDAMLRKGINSGCIPMRRRKPSEPPPDPDAFAEIEEIIMTDAANPQRMRLRIGMVLWQCGRNEAAAKLGISRATAYRVVSPVRQNPKTKQSHG